MVCARKGLLCRSTRLEAVLESSQPDPHSTQTGAGSEGCTWGLGPCPLGPATKQSPAPSSTYFCSALANQPLLKTDPWESWAPQYLHTKDPCFPKLMFPPRRAPSLKGYNPPMQWLRRKKRHKVTSDQINQSAANQKHHQPRASTCCARPRCLLQAFGLRSGKKSLLCTKWLGSKQKTVYCHSQIHTSNKCSSF